MLHEHVGLHEGVRVQEQLHSLPGCQLTLQHKHLVNTHVKNIHSGGDTLSNVSVLGQALCSVLQIMMSLMSRKANLSRNCQTQCLSTVLDNNRHLDKRKGDNTLMYN